MRIWTVPEFAYDSALRGGPALDAELVEQRHHLAHKGSSYGVAIHMLRSDP